MKLNNKSNTKNETYETLKEVRCFNNFEFNFGLVLIDHM